jgi:hypothetical protein
MKRAVVDTNVPIIANDRPGGSNDSRTPSPSCRLNAINFLLKIMKSGCVFLDLAGEIQAEYRRYLNPAGQPGVGDRFYLELLRRGPPHVQHVELPKASDGSYKNYPKDRDLASFDPSDRKFVALSLRAKAPVVVATDSDWVHHKTALNRNGVKIRFLCGCDRNAWFS